MTGPRLALGSSPLGKRQSLDAVMPPIPTGGRPLGTRAVVRQAALTRFTSSPELDIAPNGAVVARRSA